MGDVGLRVKHGGCKIKIEEGMEIFFVFCPFNMGEVIDNGYVMLWLTSPLYSQKFIL
jgi:hypothetical protein